MNQSIKRDYPSPSLKVVSVAAPCQIQQTSGNQNKVPVEVDDEPIF